MKQKIIIGSRGSDLALWQANFVKHELEKKNKNVLVVAGYYLAGMTLVLFFVRDYWIMVILLIVWGGGLGGFWAIYPPTFAETIDEAVLMFQSREEGIYNGIKLK